jgi:lipoprotein-anchoring transpeptidase ErfK/SrfK
MARRAAIVALTAAALSVTAPAAASVLDAAAARKAPKSVIVASATLPEIGIFTEPDTPAPAFVLANPTPTGGQLVFLVEDVKGAWLEVLLPIRPNGSTGWIRATDALVAPVEYRIVVDLSEHRLSLLKSGKSVLRAPAGIGKANTPTPGGEYFLTQLFEPPDPGGPYGPFAFSLSGFSDVLTSFRGGDAIIGIHGTNKPELVGQDVSAGCIRVTNDVIKELAKVVPLGTPVELRK